MVDSSDEEEKNANAKLGGQVYYKCTQESDTCIIFYYNPNLDKKKSSGGKISSSKESDRRTSERRTSHALKARAARMSHDFTNDPNFRTFS